MGKVPEIGERTGSREASEECFGEKKGACGRGSRRDCLAARWRVGMSGGGRADRYGSVKLFAIKSLGRESQVQLGVWPAVSERQGRHQERNEQEEGLPTVLTHSPSFVGQFGG